MGKKLIEKLDEIDKSLDVAIEKEDLEFLENVKSCSEIELDQIDKINSVRSKFMLMTVLFPFQVLATNRMLYTVIQRKRIQ